MGGCVARTRLTEGCPDPRNLSPPTASFGASLLYVSSQLLASKTKNYTTRGLSQGKHKNRHAASTCKQNVFTPCGKHTIIVAGRYVELHETRVALVKLVWTAQ